MDACSASPVALRHPPVCIALTTRTEIIGLRNAMWEKVASRLHSPLKIFPAGAKGADEVMLYGTVAYTFKDGRKGSVDWAARANLVKEDGRVKMKYYQVYLVGSFLV